MSPKSTNVVSGNILAEPITLFHRRQQNCQLRVEIEQSATVETKADIEDLIRKTETTPELKDFELPCEIVGIDAAETVTEKKSKKAKAKKSVKVRFHPTVLRCARTNERLRAAVRGTAKRLLDQFFGQDWTIDPPAAVDPVTSLADSLRQLLTTRRGFLRATPESTTITWPLADAHALASRKSVASLLASSKKSLKVRVLDAKDSSDRLTNATESGAVQIVDVTVERNGTEAGAVQLHFIDFARLMDSNSCDHIITVNQERTFIRMRFFHPQISDGQVDLCGVARVAEAGKEMIQSTQLHVESLGKILSATLHLESAGNDDTSSSCNTTPATSPVRKTSSERRPLNTLHQTDDGVVIRIARSRFTVSPAPNAEPAATVDSQPRSLHVVIAADKISKENVNGADATTHVAHASPGSYSPTDSADSGVASWGDLSPSPTSGAAVYIPPKGERATIRPRSNSVNFLSESSFNTGSTTSINGLPLKGILKKSRGSFSSTTSSTSGGGLRRTTRFVLARSVSECHDELSAAEAFHGVVLNSMAIAEAFGEDEEERSVAGINGSLSSVSEEGEIDSEGSVEPHQRKKRVSFNEHVQARVYRSNSSILGQKKKNERKNRSKRKRSESEGDHSDSVESDAASKIEDGDQPPPSQDTTGADSNNTPKSATLERHDSGIDEPHTTVPKTGAATGACGVWRTRSTDSAVVEDHFGGAEIDVTSL